MPIKEPITFSPSSLGTFLEAPRRFWLEQHHGLKLPDGIRSSIPNAIDTMIKDEYDAARGKRMPRALESLIGKGAKLHPSSDFIRTVRNYRQCNYTDPVSGATVRGALDDALLFADGRVASLDCKTTSAGRDLPEYAKRYYRTSQSCYALMLDKLVGREFSCDSAWLVFYQPEAFKDAASPGLYWRSDVVELALDREHALKVIRDAAACLRGPLPDPGADKFDPYIMRYAEVVNGAETEDERRAHGAKARATKTKTASADDIGL